MSNIKRNFYDILNVTSDATIDELKSNYKQLILQCHPDKLLQQQQQKERTLEENSDKNETSDPNNVEFVAITEAWNCLKDPIKRKQYNAELLLNKFHTHNNIYAHVKLSEMKKQLNTEAAANTDDDNDDENDGKEEVKVQKEECYTSKYIYTYECRCGGQYIVDESAEQYCRINNHGSQTKNNDNNDVEHNNGVDDDDDAVPTNNIKNKNNASEIGGGDGGHEGIILDEDNGYDEEGDELIVECSECSLVIILNG